MKKNNNHRFLILSKFQNFIFISIFIFSFNCNTPESDTNTVSNSDELIRRDDLVIDLARIEVSVAGRPIVLAFREYELLKFLASNPGRVFTRDVLLDRVWGYDYFGGDRTVDVHIRRLRSKIEDSGHVFIETVRNIGYRFKKNT